MALENALLIANVAHARTRPKVNRFHYRVYYLAVALRELPLLQKLSVFAVNGFNLFSLREKDYGRSENPEAWIRQLLKEWSVTKADGDVVVVTLPRVLGYAFNPVTFWFCLDKEKRPRAVLADVSNTFGEHHSYLLSHEDQRPITSEDWLASKKVFHVSPFIEITGHYEFRFLYEETRIGVWINHHDAEGLLLTTSVVGERTELSSRTLMRCFFNYPLVTFKVIGLIHYQALRLILKGVRYHIKPLPPSTEITR